MAKKTNDKKTINTKKSLMNSYDTVLELELYKHIVEGTKNVFYKFSTIYGNLSISPNIKSVLGISSRQLKLDPKLWQKSIHELDVKKVLKKIKSLKINQVLELEYRFIKPNSKTVWLRDRLVCIKKNKNETVVQGFATDITTLKNSEIENQLNQKKYESIFNQASDGIVVGKYTKKNQGEILDLNNAVLQMTGYNKSELIGKDISALFDKGDIKDKPLRYDLVLKGKEVVANRRLKLKNKKLIPIEMRSKMMTDGSLISFIRDVSDSIKSKRLLEESEKRYRALIDEVIESSSVGIFILDSNFKVVWINKRTEKLFGLKKKDVIGKDKRDLIKEKIKNLFENPQNFQRKILSSYKKKEYIKNFECRVLARGRRKEKWLLHWSQPISDGLFKGGRIEHYTDITDQKNTEDFLTKYKNIVSSTQDAISLVDDSYTYLVVNQTYLNRSGLKREDIVGKSVAEYLGRDTFIKSVKPHFDRCLKGEVINYQEWFEYKLEGKLFIDVTYFPYYDSNNKITGVIANSRDITERKNSELKLSESEMRFQNMADTAPVLIWMSDTTKKCTYFNKVWLDFTGRKLEEELGNGWSEGVYKDDLEYCLKTYNDAFEKRNEFKMEYRLLHSDGSYRWVYDHGVPRFSESGEFVGYIGSCIDINEQRDLIEKYRLQSEMIQNMAEGACLVSVSDGIILYANLSFKKMFGYQEGELVGKDVSILNAETDISAKEVASQIMSVLKEEKCWDGEVYNKRKDGSKFWTHSTITSYNHPAYGEVWIVAQSDITVEKEFEFAKNKERKRLEILHDLYSKADHMSDAEMYKFIIDSAVDLTESKHGFFHRINNDQKIINLTAWSTTTLKDCNAIYENHYSIDEAGNWVECVRQRKPIVFNNFKLSPQQKGLPEGHTDIKRMISFPVIYENKVKFIFGVGNKESDYTDSDVLQVQLVADELQKIIASREAKAELIASNKRLKEAEQIGGIGYFYFTLPEGKSFWSDETFRLFNRDPKLGAPTEEEYYRYIHPEDAGIFKEKLNSAIENLDSFDFEYRVIIDSEVTYLQAIGKIMTDSKGCPDGVSGVVKNITDYKNALLAIKENEEKFEKAFKTSPDALAITRVKDGMYIDINDSFKRILDYDRDEMIGKSSIELNIWKYESDRERLIKGLKEKGYVENLDAEYLTKNGDVIYGLMSARLVKLGDEDVILSITRDITERKAMEKELEISELRYKKLISNISDVIVLIDKQGKISYKSSNLGKYFGWDPEDLIGKGALYTCHPDDYEKILPHLERLLKQNELQVTVEFNYRCKDGSYKPIELTAVSLINDPIINGVIANYRDISERKKAEKAIVETQRLGAIGEMSSAVAHDFNNSLQSIFGNLELAIMNLNQGHQSQKFLESIKIAATDAATRVKLLQRFAGTSQTREEYFKLDLNQIVKDVIIQSRPMWKNRPEKEGIVINLEANYGDPKPVMGNDGELRSVLYNMIKNSVEAMPDGGTISITTYKKDNFSCIQLMDQGTGMDEETKSRIFQPFFTTKGFESGRGMGMSGAYSIVKEHNGNIYIKESSPGNGTTLIIELPQKEEIELAAKETQQRNDFRNRFNILWIDDEKNIREIGNEMIKILGHSVLTVDSYQKAFDLLDNDKYDLIITDIGMPGMNGWEVADKINERFNGKIKIAVITGWGDQITKSEIEKHGVIDLLAKPFGFDELKKFLINILEK